MKNKTNVITICGSLKFKDKMLTLASKMELEGNNVLIPILPVDDKIIYTKEEIIKLGNMHKKKIDISDEIFVVNVKGYIGESTKSEIEYAKKHGKKISYLEN